MTDLIKNSVEKFQLNLQGLNVLTEAASGNFKCTPLIAALAGAHVVALGKDSKYGKYETIRRQIRKLARQLQVEEKIQCINNYDEIDLASIDILTNTGFLRPVNKPIIDRLSSDCVIPLMYEPWEFRKTDLDLEYCCKKGIKVYGTNESDSRLLTMKYIGFIVLYFLLKEKKTPFSCQVLIIGSEKFNRAIEEVLGSLHYTTASFTPDQAFNHLLTRKYNVIVFSEFVDDRLLMGNSNNALISNELITNKHLLIHIAGNIDVKNIKGKIYPKQPALPHYMSYTTDFIDPVAVIDLQTAGLKVGEGMLKANKLKLMTKKYKKFMEDNYPALAFNNPDFY